MHREKRNKRKTVVNQNKKIKKSLGIKGLENKHWEETKVLTGELTSLERRRRRLVESIPQ